MIVLKILGLILAAIILLIAVILALPIDIIIRNDKEKGVQLLYRLLGKIYGENPDPNNPIAKALKNIVGVSHLESKERLQSTVEQSGLAATVSGTALTLKLLLDRILWLLPRCKLRKLKIISVSADADAADAALHYGAACAVLYPLISYLETVMKVRKKAVRTHITCDFEAAEPVFELDMELRLSILLALRVLWHIAKEQAISEIENNPEFKEVPHGKQENE